MRLVFNPHKAVATEYPWWKEVPNGMTAINLRKAEPSTIPMGNNESGTNPVPITLTIFSTSKVIEIGMNGLGTNLVYLDLHRTDSPNIP